MKRTPYFIFIIFSWETYFSSFHLMTWLAIVTTMLLSSLVFWLILKQEKQMIVRENERARKNSKALDGATIPFNMWLHEDDLLLHETFMEEDQERASLLTSIFMHFGCLMQQGLVK